MSKYIPWYYVIIYPCANPDTSQDNLSPQPRTSYLSPAFPRESNGRIKVIWNLFWPVDVQEHGHGAMGPFRKFPSGSQILADAGTPQTLNWLVLSQVLWNNPGPYMCNTMANWTVEPILEYSSDTQILANAVYPEPLDWLASFQVLWNCLDP